MAGDQDVHVELALHQLQRVLIVPRHNLMAVTQADSELANGDHFLVWIIRRRLVRIGRGYESEDNNRGHQFRLDEEKRRRLISVLASVELLSLKAGNFAVQSNENVHLRRRSHLEPRAHRWPVS